MTANEARRDICAGLLDGLVRNGSGKANKL